MSLSSIPAPIETHSPFPEQSRMFQVCYLSRTPIGKNDACVYFPISFSEEGFKPAPVKVIEFFKILGICSKEEQEAILKSYFGFVNGDKRVLLWRKLSRHRPDIFNMLLAISGTRH